MSIMTQNILQNYVEEYWRAHSYIGVARMVTSLSGIRTQRKNLKHLLFGDSKFTPASRGCAAF
jgi:hypothetical protein